MKWVILATTSFGTLFLVGVGGIPLWMGLRFVWRGLASTRWPTAPGVVLKSAVSETEASQKSGTYTLSTYTFYVPELSFGYQVKGRDYTTKNLQFGRAEGSGDASEAAVLMLRYPVGAKVSIRYHPSDPALGVVQSGVNSVVVWYLMAGLVFILFGVVVLLAYIGSEWELFEFRRVMGLMWFIFIFFGVGMLTPGLLSLWRAKASENWPTVNGVIVFSEQDGTDSRVPLAYEYEVNGEKHFSNVRHFGQFAESKENWADAILKRHPTGTQVPVTYCPTDPDVAALESGINPEAWYLPGGGAAFLLFGLAALYMFLRR
ncbi:MAG: DUF3592 domain-containing protein [Bryobacteraceae bacterium]|jgi:hypothetical protein